ncbi:MAG: hypothetical protein II357_02825 [Clostridia bacterium]|nr:hypothetical protein [Clostridia bacterium]
MKPLVSFLGGYLPSVIHIEYILRLVRYINKGHITFSIALGILVYRGRHGEIFSFFAFIGIIFSSLRRISIDIDKTGVGLGLYISKSIIDAHGEEIWVKSRYGEYCEFIFTLTRATDGQIKKALQPDTK